MTTRPLAGAIESGDSYDIAVLAPRVAYERHRVAKAFPKAVVFEVPAKVFGSHDAAADLRLIEDAPNRHNHNTLPDHGPLTLPADMRWSGCIKVVAATLGTRQSSFDWRVFAGGKMVLEGRTAKLTFDVRNIEDPNCSRTLARPRYCPLRRH